MSTSDEKHLLSPARSSAVSTSPSQTPGKRRRNPEAEATKLDFDKDNFRDVKEPILERSLSEIEQRPSKKQIDHDQDSEEQTIRPLSELGQQVEDESFFDLINTFASLDIPDRTPEQCPLCPRTLPLSEFATHVYECLKKLEDVEREHQLQLDEKLAQRLSEEEGSAGAAMGMSPPKFRPKDYCEKGTSCTRTDAQHFVNLYHPPVSCPICQEEYPVFEVNAHLNLCLTNPTRRDPFAPRRNPTEISLDSNDPIVRLAKGEDADDDEDEALSPSASPTDDVKLGNVAAVASSVQLNHAQLAAMAKSVVQQRAREAKSRQGDDDNDVSLLSMLDTFKSLGFTKENLSKARKEHEELQRANSNVSMAILSDSSASSASLASSSSSASSSSTSSSSSSDSAPADVDENL